ncbi:unnamed protein product [Symbiodinium sp. KB8]|nr:unnamed protein product [Symbiodinium sp. KB8]
MFFCTGAGGDDDPPTDGLGFKVGGQSVVNSNVGLTYLITFAEASKLNNEGDLLHLDTAVRGVEGSNYASKLITQFGGRETDTSSCLAFAPQSRRSRKTRSDWQVSNKDDFIKLEPYAVPCGVGWMKSNPTKWEGGSDLEPWECPFVATFGGYAFYTSELAIEKCLTVTYKMFVSSSGIESTDTLRDQVHTIWVTGSPSYVRADTLTSCIQAAPEAIVHTPQCCGSRERFPFTPNQGPSESGIIMPADGELALFYRNRLPCLLAALGASCLASPLKIGRLYADAFITMHGDRRCANRWMGDMQKLRESTNGWGAIYMNPSGSRCSFRAQVPETVLCQCFSSRDYIYWLESMAQLISIVVPMTRSRPQQKGLIVNFQRLTSHANLSDEVFRGDFSKADDLGCQRLEPSIEKAWPDFLRLQEAPADWAAWDYQAIVDSLFA